MNYLVRCAQKRYFVFIMWNDDLNRIQLIILEAATALSLILIVTERAAGEFEKTVLRILRAWATIKEALTKND
jgi:hypothetical protein